MKTTQHFTPEADAGAFQPSANDNEIPPRYGDKRAVAAMLGLSKRSVDNLLAQGCPHLKLGARRVRFELDEVRQWLREQFRVQRRGPVRASANGGQLQ